MGLATFGLLASLMGLGFVLLAGGAAALAIEGARNGLFGWPGLVALEGGKAPSLEVSALPRARP